MVFFLLQEKAIGVKETNSRRNVLRTCLICLGLFSLWIFYRLHLNIELLYGCLEHIYRSL